MVRAVARDDAELQHAHQDAHGHQVPDVLVGPQRPHRRLGVEVQLEALEQLVAEDAQGAVPGLATALRVEGRRVREGVVAADHRQA